MISRAVQVAAVALVVLSGCGPRLPTVVSAKGTVVNKGKGPSLDLAGYQVQLQSLTEASEMPGGPIGEDGSFTLYTRVGGSVIPGVKPGSYQACVLPPPAEGGAQPRIVIPARYLNFDTANLKYEILAPKDDLVIEIERSN
jgi:hypothetical protein